MRITNSLIAMPNPTTLSLLGASYRSSDRPTSPTRLVVIALIIVAAIASAGLFWIIGGLRTAPVLPFLTYGLVLAGLVFGLAGRASYRPNGFWWTSTTAWLWSQTAPLLALASALAVIIAAPYMLSHHDSRTTLSWLATVLSAVLLVNAATAGAAAAAMLVRRISPNPFIRLSLVVMLAYGFGLLLFGSGVMLVIELALVSANANAVIGVLLLAVAATVVAVLLLQLAIDQTPLTSVAQHRFWPALTRLRLVSPRLSPAAAEAITALRFYYRSAAFQRRVAVALLIAGGTFLAADQVSGTLLGQMAQLGSLVVLTLAFLSERPGRGVVPAVVSLIGFGLLTGILALIFTNPTAWYWWSALILAIVTSWQTVGSSAK